jgi:hypothetical protein
MVYFLFHLANYTFSELFDMNFIEKSASIFKKSISGLGPTNENTQKNSLNSCQIFRLLKLVTHISDCVHMKQF